MGLAKRGPPIRITVIVEGAVTEMMGLAPLGPPYALNKEFSMSISSPEDEPNGYTPFDEHVYVFTDNAIVPPAKAEPPDEQPDQKS